jgi:DNA-binding MarR family transcriptional regulator
VTEVAKWNGHTPPTASIGELEYQDRLQALYERLFPDLDPEPYVLGMAIMRISGAMRMQMDTKIYQPTGHSIAHIRILMALSAVGPTTPSELARFNQVSASSVSSVLRTLRRNGHVEQEAPDDDADGRVKIVRLTKAGEAAMKRLMKDMRGLEESWATTLTEAQRRRLLALLRTLTEHLQQPD